MDILQLTALVYLFLLKYKPQTATILDKNQDGILDSGDAHPRPAA